MGSELEPRPAKVADPATRITREDLAALAVAHERLTRRTSQLASVGLTAGLAVGAVLLLLSGLLKWPPVLDVPFFALGWAIGLVWAALVRRRYVREVRRYELECPRCGAQIPEPTWRYHEATRAELAIATGHCPKCGADLCEPEG